MSTVFELAFTLEKKVELLLDKVRDLSRERDSLEQQVQELSRQKRELHEELLRERSAAGALKMANAILGGNEYSAKAKSEINALIREIDACIVQLSK